jgi:hypothetical protein
MDVDERQTNSEQKFPFTIASHSSAKMINASAANIFFHSVCQKQRRIFSLFRVKKNFLYNKQKSFSSPRKNRSEAYVKILTISAEKIFRFENIKSFA